MHPKIEVKRHHCKAYCAGNSAVREDFSELAAENRKRRQRPERLYQVRDKVTHGECVHHICGVYAKLLCGGHNVRCFHHKLRSAGGHKHIKQRGKPINYGCKVARIAELYKPFAEHRAKSGTGKDSEDSRIKAVLQKHVAYGLYSLFGGFDNRCGRFVKYQRQHKEQEVAGVEPERGHSAFIH